jgi:hypothetical protein
MPETTKKAKSPAKPRAVSASVSAAAPPVDKVAELAYTLWVERGCPIGNADHDWLRAEQQLLINSATF